MLIEIFHSKTHTPGSVWESDYNLGASEMFPLCINLSLVNSYYYSSSYQLKQNKKIAKTKLNIILPIGLVLQTLKHIFTLEKSYLVVLVFTSLSL